MPGAIWVLKTEMVVHILELVGFVGMWKVDFGSELYKETFLDAVF